MSTTTESTYAIFTTGDFVEHTDKLQYVTQGEDEEEAFSTFADDILSDTGEEEGWTWHVYEIPSDELSDDEIYEYVSDRTPTAITS